MFIKAEASTCSVLLWLVFVTLWQCCCCCCKCVENDVLSDERAADLERAASLEKTETDHLY